MYVTHPPKRPTATITMSLNSTLEALHLRSPPSPFVMPSSEQVDELRAKYAHQSQDHVFAFWEDISNDEKAELFNQLSSIDPSRVTRIAETVFGSKTDTTGEVVPPPAESSASA